MVRALLVRKVTLLLLLVILAAPWSSAAAPRQLEARSTKATTSPLELLSKLWTFLTDPWSESGCLIDPSGHCVPVPEPRTDEGCHIDPDGRCGS